MDGLFTEKDCTEGPHTIDFTVNKLLDNDNKFLLNSLFFGLRFREG